MKNFIWKWAKDLNRHLFKYSDIFWHANKHEGCSMSHVIRELQITTTRCHYTPIDTAKIQKSDDTKCWQCGTTKALIHCWWECKMVSPLWKAVWQFLAKPNSPTIQCSNSAPRYLLNGAETRLHKNCFMQMFTA